MKLFTAAFLFILLSFSTLSAQTGFSQANANDILKTLSVTIGPRPMGSPAEQRALALAVEKFIAYGCDTAYIMPMERSSDANTSSGIAIGILRGATGRAICIGGHIDSAGPEIPGADDDGSGSAVVMELARVFGQRENMQSALVFCCFGGEEMGLEGSRYFVDHYAGIDSIVLMLQVDMANGLGVIDMDPDTHGKSAPRWLVDATVEEFTRLGYENLRYPTHFMAFNYAMPQGSGSDHEPFIKAGIPAIDFSTDVTKPIHTPGDTYENFEQDGLQRSGDLVLRLVERFDGGVPSRTTEQYWLYLLGSTPIMLPLWVLVVFTVLSLILSVAAVVVVRARRHPLEEGEVRIRWSGWKLFLFTIIIVMFAWFSNDLPGALKGVRHAWFTEISLYYAYAAVFALLGVWVVLRIAKRALPITRRPEGLFLRAVIVLLLYAVPLALWSAEIGIYPALSLLLLSAAMLIRRPAALKIFFGLLAPLPMLRLVFSEWIALFWRAAGGAPPPSSFLIAAAINAGTILFFALVLYPFVLGWMAVARDTPSLGSLGARLRSPRLALGLLAVLIAFTAFLVPREVYNRSWNRTVKMTQSIDLDSSGAQKIALAGFEYLDGVRITYDGKDTTLSEKILQTEIVPAERLDSTVVDITRTDSTRVSGDTLFVDVTLTMNARMRPYTVNLSYTPEGKKTVFTNFSSSYLYTTKRDESKVLKWYSFPDSVLTIPVSFAVTGNGSVKEEIKVLFADLVYPMGLERELTDFIRRTEVVSRRVYRK